MAGLSLCSQFFLYATSFAGNAADIDHEVMAVLIEQTFLFRS